jgi:predicted NAD/FAD-binding protein
MISVGGVEALFDKVILATHAPISRSLLKSDFPDLAAELSPFQVSRNNVDLHEDESVMPKKRICWSAWNVQARDTVADVDDISLSYYINKLQPLASDRQHFVTLNARRELKRVQRSFVYDHPQFDFEAIDAQKRLPSLQGRSGIFLAGAWTRYGFHEDGILSAVNATQAMGCEPPWK